MEKTILLTGGTGFLGTLLSNNLNNYTNLIFLGKEEKQISKNIYQFDINNLNNNFYKHIQNINIIHLATYYSKSSYDKKKIQDANIDFGMRLLESIDSSSINSFIYTNTMFAFDEDNKNHFYTKSKIEFSEILKSRLGDNKISEIYLDNTFHNTDKRNKVVPAIISAIKNNTTNPVNNEDDFINLSYGVDVVKAIISEALEPENLTTRITSMFDINIKSIYEYLDYYYKANVLDESLLKVMDSTYLDNKEIPPLNSKFYETDIYKNLVSLLKSKKE